MHDEETIESHEYGILLTVNKMQIPVMAWFVPEIDKHRSFKHLASCTWRAPVYWQPCLRLYKICRATAVPQKQVELADQS